MKTNTEKQAKWIWTIVLAVAFTIMFFARSGEAVKADVTVNTWNGLQNAINSAPDNVPTTIKLTGDITPGTPTAADAYINIGSDKKIILDLNGHIMN